MIDGTESRDDTAAGFPRAYLRPCLLLLLAESPSHGYDLLEQVRALGVRVSEPGGLYRALRSMDEDGLVASWWEPSQAGPARRLYVITDPGRAALDAFATEVLDVRSLLDALLQRYGSLSHRSARTS